MGSWTTQVGDERGVLAAGDLLWFPRTVPHAIANHSGSPCRFLTVVTPAGIEDFFRAQRDYLAGLPEGIAPDPAALSALPGSESRQVAGSPLSPIA